MYDDFWRWPFISPFGYMLIVIVIIVPCTEILISYLHRFILEQHIANDSLDLRHDIDPLIFIRGKAFRDLHTEFIIMNGYFSNQVDLGNKVVHHDSRMHNPIIWTLTLYIEVTAAKGIFTFVNTDRFIEFD